MQAQVGYVIFSLLPWQRKVRRFGKIVLSVRMTRGKPFHLVADRGSTDQAKQGHVGAIKYKNESRTKLSLMVQERVSMSSRGVSTTL